MVVTITVILPMLNISTVIPLTLVLPISITKVNDTTTIVQKFTPDGILSKPVLWIPWLY